MKVALIYRNYKKLHPLYQSLIADPPENVNYHVAPARRQLKLLFPLLTKFSHYSFVRWVIRIGEQVLFDITTKEDVDLIHFAQVLPPRIPKTPFVVDHSHPISFFSHMVFSDNDIQKVWQTLSHKQCKGIIGLSEHSVLRLKQLFAKYPFEEIQRKVTIIYPALSVSHASSKSLDREKYIQKKDGKLNFLFVGKEVYRKGLHELLAAFHTLTFPHIRLHVVSDAPEKLMDAYKDDSRITFYESVFSKEEILTYFFKQSDVFVMPTHADTFGMVFLDALASGVPVITTCQFVGKEIIREGINGFFVDSERLTLETKLFPDQISLLSVTEEPEQLLVESLKTRMIEVIKNPSILEPMKRAAAQEFESNGRFSVSTRNNALLSLYKQALNG